MKTAPTTNALLYLNGVTVTFDGFKALNDLSLVVEEGELRTIIGPNGAGKTTMMDVVTGKTRPDSGEVFFAGSADLSRLDESSIANLGIGRKFQRPTVFENLTVVENLELALAEGRGTWTTLFSQLTSERRDRISADIGPHRSFQAERAAGRRSQSRSEAMARDRHAADP